MKPKHIGQAVNTFPNWANLTPLPNMPMKTSCPLFRDPLPHKCHPAFLVPLNLCLNNLVFMFSDKITPLLKTKLKKILLPSPIPTHPLHSGVSGFLSSIYCGLMCSILSPPLFTLHYGSWSRRDIHSQKKNLLEVGDRAVFIHIPSLCADIQHTYVY